ncbi:MAG: cation:proton antiporter [Hymenobacteraceae bacterium]|nr:cation:proton antiporter [Hymenobacteraceae bacterium]MDX5482957.1 cation:proton antiporter [Hymenobacteraceae bacterium]
MKTLIFATAIRLLTPLFLLFSVYILFRGHNHPGGGFIGGLIGSLAFVFHALAYGSGSTAQTFFSLTFYHYDRQPDDSRTRYLLQVLNANTLRRRKVRNNESWRYVLVRLRPIYLMALGLFLAASSGTVGLLLGQPYMAGRWLGIEIPVIGGLGTPLMFDAGVYLLVLGMVLKIVFTISRD